LYYSFSQQEKKMITWLHLSDLHIRSSDEYNRNIVLQAFLKDLKEQIAEKQLQLDFALITGDIAFSGVADEYSMVRQFWDDLIETTNLSKERLFVIPGNHDVNRKSITRGAASIVNDLNTRDAVNEFLDIEEDKTLVFRKFQHYAEFVNDYFEGHISFNDEQYFYVKPLELSDKRIAIFGLNSSWASGSHKEADGGKVNDKKYLLLGERQVRDALEAAIDVDIRIAALHHPFDLLKEFDQNDVEPLLKQNCDFILHGHLHRAGILQPMDPDSKTTVIAAGACYESRDYPNMYNFVRLNFETGKGTIYLRRYSDEQGGFWTKDVMTYRNVPDGEYVFDLPVERQTTIPQKPDRSSTLRRYLESVAEEHKHWRHLYVELEGQTTEMVASEEQTGGLSALIEPELVEYVVQPSEQPKQVKLESLFELVDKPYNVMLLGEPGSGKTTALKRIVLKVAEDALQSEVLPSPQPSPFKSEVGYSEGRIPILLQLSSLQNADVEGWVGKRCELLQPYLDGYLKSGQCVFLWDALNEMPFESEEQYAAKLNALKQFMKDYPDNRFIWSCRRLDYKESLPLHQVEILLLSLEKIRQFFHNLREIGEGKACDALSEEFEKRGGKFDELFGRPLMLELLCAVYEYNRQADEPEPIPQNRGKLFETFVNMLMGREQKKVGVLPRRYPPEVQKVALQSLAFDMMDTAQPDKEIKSRSGTAVFIDWARSHLPKNCYDAQNRPVSIDPDELLDLAAGETILEFLSNRSQVRFWHQSLQEYFAALELQERLNAREDLTRILKPPWWWEGEAPPLIRTRELPPPPTGWEETVIMLTGIHPSVYELIRVLIEYKNPILAGRCLNEGLSDKELVRLETIKTDVAQALVETVENPKVALPARIVAGDRIGFLGDPRLVTPQTVNSYGAREYLIGREDGKGMSVMVEIPAGTFLMGSTDNDNLARDNEKPQREVYLDSYLIDKYPVTYSQYREFIEDKGYYQRRWWSDDGWECLEAQKRKSERWDARLGIVRLWNNNRFNKPNSPVVGVTWYEADAFARWCGKQLPTEAQWEKAARGIDGRIYPWGDNFDPKRCNCWKSESPVGPRNTTSVGIYPTGASPYGILDMAGNVWEWCFDEYQGNFSGRVLRGGSWLITPDSVRVAFRGWGVPGGGYGFRCTLKTRSIRLRGIAHR